jgi:hypothetical protein
VKNNTGGVLETALKEVSFRESACLHAAAERSAPWLRRIAAARNRRSRRLRWARHDDSKHELAREHLPASKHPTTETEREQTVGGQSRRLRPAPVIDLGWPWTIQADDQMDLRHDQNWSEVHPGEHKVGHAFDAAIVELLRYPRATLFRS